MLLDAMNMGRRYCSEYVYPAMNLLLLVTVVLATLGFSIRLSELTESQRGTGEHTEIVCSYLILVVDCLDVFALRF